MSVNPQLPPYPQHSYRKPPKDPGKKSAFIALGVVGAVAASVLACCALSGDDDEVVADCVDSERSVDGYRIVDDDECDDDGYQSSYHSYFWYYGGTRHGSFVRSGSTVKPKGTKIVSRSGKTIQKGGFGSRFSGGGG